VVRWPRRVPPARAASWTPEHHRHQDHDTQRRNRPTQDADERLEGGLPCRCRRGDRDRAGHAGAGSDGDRDEPGGRSRPARRPCVAASIGQRPPASNGRRPATSPPRCSRTSPKRRLLQAIVLSLEASALRRAFGGPHRHPILPLASTRPLPGDARTPTVLPPPMQGGGSEGRGAARSRRAATATIDRLPRGLGQKRTGRQNAVLPA